MLKLILQDFKANKDIILFRTILPAILISFFFAIPYIGLDKYWIFCCMIVIVGNSFYHIRDKKIKIELLTCSLPVSRNRIVYSKYLAALLLTIFVLLLACLTAYLADLLWEIPANRFSEFFNLKVLLMFLFLIVLHFSLFLPSVFVFRTTGVIISFIISLVLSIYSTESLLVQYDKPINIPSKIVLDPEYYFGYIILLIVLIILPLISIFISKYLYNKKDF